MKIEGAMLNVRQEHVDHASSVACPDTKRGSVKNIQVKKSESFGSSSLTRQKLFLSGAFFHEVLVEAMRTQNECNSITQKASSFVKAFLTFV